MVAGIFVSVDYLLMRKTFNEYIEVCREVAKKHISKLGESSSLL
jgi:hypothetical protein